MIVIVAATLILEIPGREVSCVVVVTTDVLTRPDANSSSCQGGSRATSRVSHYFGLSDGSIVYVQVVAYCFSLFNYLDFGWTSRLGLEYDRRGQHNRITYN